MKRWIGIAFFSLFFCASAFSQSLPQKSFMEKEVQLTLQSAKGSSKVTKKTNPNKVREAVTALNGKEKSTQVYLIQRFLADAKANVQMSIKIDDDLYELNNTNPKDSHVLYWTITFTDEKKIKALSDYLEKI